MKTSIANFTSRFVFSLLYQKKLLRQSLGSFCQNLNFQYNPNLNTFLKNFVTSTENTCARISFLIKSQALGFRNSCEFLVKFSEQLGIAASEK